METSGRLCRFELRQSVPPLPPALPAQLGSLSTTTSATTKSQPSLIPAGVGIQTNRQWRHSGRLCRFRTATSVLPPLPPALPAQLGSLSTTTSATTQTQPSGWYNPAGLLKVQTNANGDTLVACAVSVTCAKVSLPPNCHLRYLLNWVLSTATSATTKLSLR